MYSFQEKTNIHLKNLFNKAPLSFKYFYIKWHQNLVKSKIFHPFDNLLDFSLVW